MDAKKIGWSEQVGQALAPALGNDLQIVADQCKRGIAQAWVWDDGYYMVTRLEPGQPKELVLVAAVGRNFVPKAAKLLKLAKAKGWAMRVHSSRPGMGRLIAPLGFQEIERVYRVV